jgi:hypothetical protein
MLWLENQKIQTISFGQILYVRIDYKLLVALLKNRNIMLTKGGWNL